MAGTKVKTEIGNIFEKEATTSCGTKRNSRNFKALRRRMLHVGNQMVVLLIGNRAALGCPQASEGRTDDARNREPAHLSTGDFPRKLLIYLRIKARISRP